MQFKKIEYYLSQPRISRFVGAMRGDTALAYELYLDNLLLSQAFMPLLSVLEVALRNALNEQLRIYFNNPDWIRHQKAGFMRDHRLHPYLLNSVLDAENKLKRLGTTVTSGKIIAELPFGFWTNLFDKTPYKVLKGQPIQIFPSLPSGIGRKDISKALNNIRRLRNRISHHEPLCFKGEAFDCQPSLVVYQQIKIVLDWMDQGIFSWIASLDTVENQINTMNRKYII